MNLKQKLISRLQALNAKYTENLSEEAQLLKKANFQVECFKTFKRVELLEELLSLYFEQAKTEVSDIYFNLHTYSEKKIISASDIKKLIDTKKRIEYLIEFINQQIN